MNFIGQHGAYNDSQTHTHLMPSKQILSPTICYIHVCLGSVRN